MNCTVEAKESLAICKLRTFGVVDEEIIAGWSILLAAFRLRYETQVKFAHPPPGHNPDLYMPPLEGEPGWTWDGEELLE